MRTIFISMVILWVTVFAEANSFKGFQRKPSQETLVITEQIDRIEETDTEFLILLKNHSAFYSFPKEKEISSTIRDYLTTCKKQKKIMVVEVDPFTARIYSISDKK